MQISKVKMTIQNLKVSKRNLAVILIVVSLVVLVISLLLTNLIKYTPQGKTTRPAVNIEKKEKEASPEAKTGVKVVTSTNPQGLVVSSEKQAKGVVSEVTPEKITIRNAFETVSYQLSKNPTLILKLIKQNNDPKIKPALPVIKEITLSDIKPNDQATIILKDKGEGYQVAEIEVERYE